MRSVRIANFPSPFGGSIERNRKFHFEKWSFQGMIRGAIKKAGILKDAGLFICTRVFGLELGAGLPTSTKMRPYGSIFLLSSRRVADRNTDRFCGSKIVLSV